MLAASDLVEVSCLGDRYCQVIKSTLVKLGAAGSNLPDISQSRICWVHQKLPRPLILAQSHLQLHLILAHKCLDCWLKRLALQVATPNRHPPPHKPKIDDGERGIGHLGILAHRVSPSPLKKIALPVGMEQWCFEYLWLYGIVEPKTGESFFAEYSHVDGVCFQSYLKWFSQNYPEELHLIQVDNGRLHTWSGLEVPENIILIFQPSYSPQVNPIERLWKEIKKHLKWELFDHLEELRNRLAQVLQRLTPTAIASVTGWDFIIDALSVANI